MSTIFSDELSFSFVMDLHRTRMKAERRVDVKALESLRQHYPDLFTEEFHHFIENLKIVAASLDQRYKKNFSNMFDPDNEDELILH